MVQVINHQAQHVWHYASHGNSRNRCLIHQPDCVDGRSSDCSSVDRDRPRGG